MNLSAPGAEEPRRPRRAEPLDGSGPAGRPWPRLLDLRGAARYLSLSERRVRDLVAAGHLPRVELPAPGGGVVRKLLLDRADLDRLVEASKVGVPTPLTRAPGLG